MKDHEYRKTVLDSGLTVHTVNVPNAKKKYYEVLILSGSASEKGITGVAHYLEHMLGYGSSTFDKKDLFPHFFSLGGRYDFGTNQFYTTYYSHALPHKVDIFAERMASVLTDPIFSSSHVEMERTPIISEEIEKRAIFETDPYMVTASKLYKGHRNSLPILGKIEDIERINYEDLKAFYDAVYVASNIHIIVAGNINHEEEVEKAKRQYATLSQKPVTLRPEPLLTVSGTHFEKMNIGGVEVKIGFVLPKSNSYEDTLDNISACIIKRKLENVLRVEKNLVYYVSGSLYREPDEKEIVIGTTVVPSSLNHLLDEIFVALSSIVNNLTEADLLDFICNQEELLIDHIDNLESQANRIQHTLVSGYDYRPLSADLDIAKKLKPEDIRDNIIRILSSEKVYMTAAGPVEDVPQIEPYVQKLREDLGIGGSDPTFGVQKGLNPNVA